MPVPYSGLTDEVALELPGCPLFIMEPELKRSAISFFNDTKTWRLPDSPTLLAGESSVIPTMPLNTALVEVVSVIYQGTSMEPTSLEATMINPVSGTTPCRFYEHDSAIHLDPKPNNLDDVTVDVLIAIKPNRNSTELPDSLVDQYFDCISKGALARLCSMPDKPWTNPQLFQKSMLEFEMGKKEAIKKAKGRSSRILVTKYRI
ncbi:MAG: hypothetical protein GY746_11140 [Gammaproteobacteria bacterium]|nr:hypothetical protein [Gammaproteobacteria bacterium]MCP4279764.1 hypothetical protein [Alteromonas sp.]